MKTLIFRMGTLLLATSPAPAVGQTRETYQRATAAFENGNWQAAETAYAKLGAALSPNSADRAVVDARRGYALFRLSQYREARNLLEAALPRLPNNAEYHADRALEHGALATIYESELWSSRPLAAQQYRLALKDADSASDRVTLLTGLVRTAMFDADFDPVATAHQAVILAQEGKLPRSSIAYAQALMGRALLNRGEPKAAFEALQAAIRGLGGLDGRIDELGFSARSDAGLAALMLGNTTVAREFFAYAGSGIGVAGRVTWPNVNFGSVACAEDMRPDDVAVVELAIDEKGAPRQVRTVYANRPGQPGHWFEDAVASWRWSAEAVKSIGPVRRQHMRFEMRCSLNWIKDHKSVEPREPWWVARGIPPFAQDKDISAEARLTAARVELAARERRYGTDGPELLPVLDALYRNELVNNLETMGIVRRALTIIERAAPPPRVLLSYREDVDRQAGGPAFDYDLRPWQAYLAEPAIAADPESRGHLRYQLSRISEAQGNWPAAYSYLNQIAADQALAETNFDKLAARRDLLQRIARDRSWAEAAKLVSTIPSVGIPCQVTPTKLLNPTVVDAPGASAKWGFGGWTFNEFDIGVDGRVVAPRVLVAYPPLVFTIDALADLARERLKLAGAAEGKGCVRQPQFIRYM